MFPDRNKPPKNIPEGIPLIIDEICDQMRNRGNLSLKLRFNRENHDKNVHS
jgi:hypothetical protein